MFSQLLRTGAITLGSGAIAFLLGCASGASAHDAALYNPSAGTQTVMIGQGGSYAIPNISYAQQTQPYALTGERGRTYPGAVSVYQNWGQATLVIPSPTR